MHYHPGRTSWRSKFKMKRWVGLRGEIRYSVQQSASAMKWISCSLLLRHLVPVAIHLSYIFCLPFSCQVDIMSSHSLSHIVRSIDPTRSQCRYIVHGSASDWSLFATVTDPVLPEFSWPPRYRLGLNRNICLASAVWVTLTVLEHL